MNTTHQERRQFFSTHILSEIIIFTAMAGALALVSHSFFSLPEGGSINLGMVPIFWLALRRGTRVGLYAGAIFGIVDLFIEPFVVHPVQFVLDYPLPFACLGFAGYFRRFNHIGPVVGVAVGGSLRFLCHFASGVIYFPTYAPEGMSPILYSAIYNATYLVPSIVICAVIIAILQKSKALNIYL
jgi:thiamine transporter